MLPCWHLGIRCFTEISSLIAISHWYLRENWSAKANFYVRDHAVFFLFVSPQCTSDCRHQGTSRPSPIIFGNPRWCVHRMWASKWEGKSDCKVSDYQKGKKNPRWKIICKPCKFHKLEYKTFLSWNKFRLKAVSTTVGWCLSPAISDQFLTQYSIEGFSVA